MDIESVLHSGNVCRCIDELLVISDRQTAPTGIVIVSPCCQIAEDLRLAAALLTMEKNASIGAFVAIVGRSTDIHGAPVVLAELLVALHVQLVPNVIFLLKVDIGRAQVLLG